MPVQRLKVAILPLDLPCSGPVTTSGEFLTTGKSHRKTPDRTQITKELKITPILEKILEYKRNWIQHVNRMPHNRLARVMNHYSPTGRRNNGRILKRLLDMCDLNGSKSDPTP
jgi:hypothetical protein